jgi:hypothetical protein
MDWARHDKELRGARTALLAIARCGLLWLAVGIAGFGIATGAAAQSGSGEPAAVHAGLDQLIVDLNLTKQQQAEAVPIVRSHRARLSKIQSRLASGDVKGLAGLKLLVDARDQVDSELAKILDPAQREQLRELREQQRARIVGAGSGSAPPTDSEAPGQH